MVSRNTSGEQETRQCGQGAWDSEMGCEQVAYQAFVPCLSEKMQQRVELCDNKNAPFGLMPNGAFSARKAACGHTVRHFSGTAPGLEKQGHEQAGENGGGNSAGCGSQPA